MNATLVILLCLVGTAPADCGATLMRHVTNAGIKGVESKGSDSIDLGGVVGQGNQSSLTPMITPMIPV